MPKIPSNPLTALEVKKLKDPGKYAMGEGLYLEAKRGLSGQLNKRWYWRGTVRGRRVEIGIGTVDDFELRDARDTARDWAKAANLGQDPRKIRDKDKAVVLTFEEAARRCIEEAVAPSLSNPKHRKQWITTFETYVFPKIGKAPIDTVTQEDIIKIIAPIWVPKHETASRTKQRIRRVFEWARPRADCDLGDRVNPADIPNDALPNIPKAEKKHHAAYPYTELPALYQRLAQQDILSAFALRFLILTACRSVEVRGATWSEIDVEKKLWTIPAARMKSRTSSHEVPLSDSALAIIHHVRGLSPTLLFPNNRNPKKPMSDSTMNALMVNMGISREQATVHGFRSTFRDWSEEQTEYSHEVKEAALAHTIKNKAEAAYRRTKLLEKRRELMDQWESFLMSKKIGL